MKDNDAGQEKYSSIIAERTEGNDCSNCLQHATERYRNKLYAWM